METDKLLNRMVRSFSHIVVILTILCSAACVTYFGKDGPYYGKIVDKESKQPLEGVVVLGNWAIVHWGPGGATSTYYDTYETVTDKNGDFTIPGQGVQIVSDLSELQLFVLKAGYEDMDGYMWRTVERSSLGKDGDRVIIGLKKLTIDERKKRLIGMPLSAPNKKYKLYRRESNAEMIQIGRSNNSIIPEE